VSRRTRKELLEAIAKTLVDNPDQVQVRAIEGEQVTVLELRVHPRDLGRVIGRQGRMADSSALSWLRRARNCESASRWKSWSRAGAIIFWQPQYQPTFPPSCPI
jgi:predicted RNA-binding protein YlqC (UPF0109 family)